MLITMRRDLYSWDQLKVSFLGATISCVVFGINSSCTTTTQLDSQ